MDLINLILEHAAKEWAVIKNAPGAAFILTALAFLVLYFAFQWRYSGSTESLKGQNDLLREQVADFASD